MLFRSTVTAHVIDDRGALLDGFGESESRSVEVAAAEALAASARFGGIETEVETCAACEEAARSC